MSKNFSKDGLERSLEMRNFLKTFLHNESIGGILLLICAIVALVGANFPIFGSLNEFWQKSAGISLSDFKIEMTIEQWINDGLMVIFFFVVGLEIKREVLVGELSSMKQAALPFFAALGGMVVPAIIYTIYNSNSPDTIHGWGIPMATDIAFALGVLSLLGKRVPIGLKIFLTALAIVDDLGAIVVIAIFYPSHALHLEMLFYAGLVVLFLLTLGRYKVHNALMYVIPGILLWWLILQSGVHATIAGVILAMTIPPKTAINELKFYVGLKDLLDKFKKVSNSEIQVLANPQQQHIIHQMNENVQKINPLMHKFESTLHPWVTFLIMPLFALANAGVLIDTKLLTFPVQPVITGIFFGLLLGKPIGIFLLSWLSVKLKFAVLPDGTKWVQVGALGIIAGIGFTMSIFIDNLAFNDASIINLGKVAILGTSLLAAILGASAILLTSRNK